MPSLATAHAANAAYQPPNGRPVAVFVGGTAGIGAGLARTFTRHRGGDVDIVLVGRNAAAARAILAGLPLPVSPNASTAKRAPLRAFVRCDAVYMREVVRAAAEIRGMVGTVNFLVVSQAVLDFNGRTETDEGIDRKMALFYYSRWKFIHESVRFVSLGDNV
jgi:NAD(P)-dependent dehydrogenase (short-subunit alcohol dehydrogenase family)